MEQQPLEEGKGSEAMMCSICLAELLVGSQATRFPCSHLYDEGCIMKWLGRSNTCPMCRQILPNM
ncbi:anaphase-promoting complex subunit 11 RING-H2 finger protein [Medicago truncatula]|uniref:RING-type E3 ubiquitin transferase n=1 Tax=Medicago truncatula TaxID=3880 RepID=G7IZ98_MEDTR|nr:anaphase-promoting complex subunit 11 RING-H2 finger protein [Medicago truncatula]